MNRILLAVLVAALLAPVGQAKAMTPAALSAADAAAAPASIPTPVAVVCGIVGCAPLQVKRYKKPPPSFTLKAVPLNLPNSNPTPKPPPANAK